MDDGHGNRVRADRALAAVRPGGLRVRSGTGAVVTLPNPALDAFEAECEALAADLDAAVVRREPGQVVQRLDRARAVQTGIAIGAAFVLGGLVVFAAVTFGVLR